ncbi:MAG: GNAT family N-acetyltransferase [Pseudomonadota bacterium]
MKIRYYLPSDLDAVMDIWYRAWHSIDSNLQHPHPKSAWETRWSADIVPTHQVVVAEQHQEVAAFAALNQQIQPAELSQIFVDPRKQGCGLGTALLDWAKQRSPAGIVLWTLEINAGSRRFYERHGFVQTLPGVNEINQLRNIGYLWSSD